MALSREDMSTAFPSAKKAGTAPVDPSYDVIGTDEAKAMFAGL
jgi:homoserine dehydrogenase